MDDKQQLRNYKLNRVKELIESAFEEHGGLKMTYQKLADILNEPLEEYGLSFSKQVIWSWAKKVELPLPKMFRALSHIAKEGSFPKRFADDMLKILELEETPAQVNIKELGYAPR
jgi:hypothetical protein